MAPPEETDDPGSSASNPAQQNITVVNRQLNIRPFTISNDVNDTAVRWAKWKKDIERQFRFFGLTDPEVKKDGLIIYGGSQIADLEDSLPDLPAQNEGEDVYSRFLRKLDRNFLPRKNKDYARFQFGNLKQEIEESMAKYYARLREIAKKCEFTNEDDAIRDHLIKTMTNSRLRVKTIRNNWTLSQILDEAAIEEESTAQANEIDQKLQDATESYKVKQVKSDKRDNNGMCSRCGTKHAKGNCRAYGAKCYNCGKRNHYTKMCRSTDHKHRPDDKQGEKSEEDSSHVPRQTRPPTDHQHRRRRVRHVEQDARNSSESEDSLDEDIARIVQHMNIHRTAQKNTKKNKCAIWINGTKTEVEQDTGADANVMDENQFNELLRATPEIRFQNTKIKLKTLTEDLPVIGECDVTLENETRKTQAKIAIIQGTIDSLPLLGRQTLEEPGMIQFDATGGLKEPNRDELQKIHKIHTGNEDLNKILLQHEERFGGIGKARRDGQDIQIHLPLKEDAKPIAQKPRRVPYHLMEPLRHRMDEFVKKDIMEKVPEHDSITWCSPLVVQPKPKNPSDIRVSLDL